MYGTSWRGNRLQGIIHNAQYSIKSHLDVQKYKQENMTHSLEKTPQYIEMNPNVRLSQPRL